jgi:sterol desaturase/sphingolipid hydroxylase (fatty acid hydroxylase superfamily)
MTISDIIHHFTHFAWLCGQLICTVFMVPTSGFSFLSLFTAATIAGGFLLSRRSADRAVRARVLIRALFPRRWFKHHSSHADIGMMGFNMFLSGSLFGWAIFSSSVFESVISGFLDANLGTGALIVVPAWLSGIVFTVAIYVAYEFAYFTNHYLSHHWSVLWQFHRVHHTAETLSPATNYRVHPVDSIVFFNMVGISIGVTSAFGHHIFGANTGQLGFGGSNAILLAMLYLLTHLHHSHMWIPFTGRMGKTILSPAHHQIHHSSDSKHFNSNFGNTLALFDWAAGTLRVPTKKREYLTFGASPLPYDPHSVTGILVMPFVDAANLAWKSPALSTDHEGRPHADDHMVTTHTPAPYSVPATTSSAA